MNSILSSMGKTQKNITVTTDMIDRYDAQMEVFHLKHGERWMLWNAALRHFLDEVPEEEQLDLVFAEKEREAKHQREAAKLNAVAREDGPPTQVPARRVSQSKRKKGKRTEGE